MRSESFGQWHRNKLRVALSIVALPALLLAGYSPAQDIYIYPAKGQSQEQQDRDRYEWVGGAITGDAGTGAAAGAAMGGLAGGMRRRDQRLQQNQQQQAAAANSQQSQRNAYHRAMAACLTGRGYTVN
jgi:hypothetical protein